MRRGEIWWADLPAPDGSEPGYRRPVLIVQQDDFNQSRISTVLAVALTSNLRLSAAPGNVLLKNRWTGLPKDSVANVSQIVTLDKACLTEKISMLPAAKTAEVDAGLRLVLDI
jgi:mRNA interferase MazF